MLLLWVELNSTYFYFKYIHAIYKILSLFSLQLTNILFLHLFSSFSLFPIFSCQLLNKLLNVLLFFIANKIQFNFHFLLLLFFFQLYDSELLFIFFFLFALMIPQILTSHSPLNDIEYQHLNKFYCDFA